MSDHDGTSRSAIASETKNEIAILAAGCFWGVEEILRNVPGVIDTEVGYTGGWLENPTTPIHTTVSRGTPKQSA
jgi:peptide methionine sulfoxide reductase MsrA